MSSSTHCLISVANQSRRGTLSACGGRAARLPIVLTGQFQKCLPDLRTEGKSPLDAIYQGCVIRFRPIMMTTMSALLGALPIAVGMGAGAESRRPLGVAVVGGLLFS